MKHASKILWVLVATAALAQAQDIVGNVRNKLNNANQQHNEQMPAAIEAATGKPQAQAPKAAAQPASRPAAVPQAAANSAKTAAPAKAAPAAAKAAPAKAAASKAPASAHAKAAPKQDKIRAESSKPEKSESESAKPEMRGARRDPFVSPVIEVSGKSGPSSECVSGKKCLTVSDLILRGIVHTKEGAIAIVENSARKTYYLKVNDQLFNGSVARITSDTVTFREQSTDAVGRPTTKETTRKLVNSPV